jgi:hypothetical protein
MGAWKGVVWFRYLLAAPSELLAEQATTILIQPPHRFTPISHS